MRVRFFVDGFNVYHSLRDASADLDLNGRGTKWLDLTGFCRSRLQLLGKDATLERVLYYSALATHLQKYSPDTVARHQRYIRCLEDQGVVVVLGRFKRARDLRCRACGERTTRNEEKETDVAIAVHLLESFIEDVCDYAVIVSGDTDLVPAVKAARRQFPKKKIAFVFPYKRDSRELVELADAHFSTKARVYQSHQFPDPLILSDGTELAKPTSW